MSNYLLLRDNKESGPYSLEDLVAKGLKPYDLVWVEGKSAAWRYPSEVNELKPFAPVVEEQPFDRFFKRAPEATSSDASQPEPAGSSDTAGYEAYQPRPVAAAIKDIPSPAAPRKIFVTLPGHPDETEAEKAAPVPEKEKRALTAAAGQDTYRQYSSAPPAAKTSSPAPAPMETAVSPVAEPAPSADRYQEPYDRYQQPPGYPVKRNWTKISLRAAIAACLILGGVVIGLLISYKGSGPNKQELNSLVKQLIDKQKEGNPSDYTRLVSDEKGNADNSIPPETDPANTSSSPGTPSTRQTPVNKPAAGKVSDLAANQSNIPAEELNGSRKAQYRTEDHQPVPSAVMPPVKETATSSPATAGDMEKTRQRIHQQLNVAGNEYKTGLLGGISDLQLTLSNNSHYQLDLVEIEVRYLSPEKRVVNTQTVLFKNVSPGQQLTHAVPKSKRGVSLDYSITRIDCKELGLAHSGF